MSGPVQGPGARAGDPRYGEVYRALLERAPEHRIEPSLDRIRAVCELMGDPQRAAPVVHLTGTNGKTSTARLVERLLREHRLRTGRFTSPHLAQVRERISLDGAPVGEAGFVAAFDDVLPYVEVVDERSGAAGGPRMTFFEVLVAMAFSAFADAPVDVAVLEVGMAGTWDATNVADGQVAVITPVSLDHEQYLGSDVAGIAREKAGIIKPGAFAVLAQQPVEAAEELLRRAGEVGATVAREGLEFGVLHREVAVGGQQVSISGLARPYEDLFLPLHGAHQAHNAACAVAAVEAFLGGGQQGLDPEVVAAALATADSPGRLEVVRRSPTVVVDAAHNPAAAQALAAAVEEGFSFSRLVGVVGMMADKDHAAVLAALEPVLDEVVLTRSSLARAADPRDLARIAVDVFEEDRVHVVDRLDDALDLAVARAEEDADLGGAGVLVTGSIPLVGEARTLLGAGGAGA